MVEFLFIFSVRERIIRLQHENKMLKQDRTETDQAEVLQTMLDEAQKRSNELQSEVRYDELINCMAIFYKDLFIVIIWSSMSTFNSIALNFTNIKQYASSAYCLLSSSF